ncbi:unnamed protein product, partial [Thlaspi arvense]
SYIVYLGSHSHGPEISPLALARVAESHYALLGSFLGRQQIYDSIFFFVPLPIILMFDIILMHLNSHENAKDAIFYSYKRHNNGFAAILGEEAIQVSLSLLKHPSVINVFQDKDKKLHTTHSWDFMQLEKDGVIPTSSLWSKARFGEDTIIGNLGTVCTFAYILRHQVFGSNPKALAQMD